ncbi:hypothetical protein CLV98_106209 [Dyadobacter jejuensis]|uniref:Uncharacterized protein n=1 Tax=Dyadobacter jejuensis TaxID=1082580 RepID=A0A316B530_9BACT|nr:hypothetical protein [Dyadobacter jejuensis]PWJ57737.1 hypothetical protein CLV98_106209 [Dyadobacter jejuensis]
MLSNLPRSGQVAKIGIYLLGCLPVVVFLIVLTGSALNLPTYDDYDTTLAFIKQFYFDQWTAGQSTFTYLIQQHNEHRILLSRLATLLYYHLFGHINFAHLVYLQNGLLFLVFFYIVHIGRRTLPGNPWIIPIVSGTLFSMVGWHSNLYFSGGIQHFASFIFAFITLYFLDQIDHQPRRNLAMALLFGFLASFSFGNGLIVMPVGVFLLWLKNKRGFALLWLMMTVLLILLYLYQLNFGQNERGEFNLLSFFKFLFAYLGIGLYTSPPTLLWSQFNIAFQLLLGPCILAMWLYLLWNGYARRRPLLYSLLTFYILAAVLLALSRSSYKIAGAITPRYSFFAKCIWLWALIIAGDAFQLPRRFYQWCTATVGVVWALSAIFIYPQIRPAQIALVEQVSAWEAGKVDYIMPHLPLRRFGDMLLWADRHGVYALPSTQQLEEIKQQLNTTHTPIDHR